MGGGSARAEAEGSSRALECQRHTGQEQGRGQRNAGSRGPPREGECPGQGRAGLAAAGEAQSKVSPDGTRTGVFTRVCVCTVQCGVCVHLKVGVCVHGVHVCTSVSVHACVAYVGTCACVCVCAWAQVWA